MKKTGYYLSPLGWIAYVYESNTLFQLKIIETMDEKDEVGESNPFIENQLNNYFKGDLNTFDIKICFNKSTPFQQQVWNALLDIEYGQTVSYQEIAEKIHRPNAYRAVGQACKKNPIGIVVPCHRVIGKDKSLTGYSGKDYIYLKKQLLDIEKKHLNQHKNL